MSETSRHVTMGLTFDTYPNKQNAGKSKSMLTHSVLVTNDAWTPMCSVRSDGLVSNETEEEDNMPPTCLTCLRRDPRFSR